MCVGGEGKSGKGISVDVVWTFDVMKDWTEFFAQHLPGHNSVGCNSVASEIDVISANVNFGTPWNGTTLLECFDNAWHLFINGWTFELGCG